MALFFALSLDVACVIDLGGNLRRANPGWESCLGWSRADLLGKPFVEFAHPDDRADTAAAIAGLAGSASTVRFKNRVRGKDGAVRWLQWNASFSRKRRLITAIAKDVTDQERLERALIAASDREKERVGRELHDGLCQNLAGIAALGATLTRKLAGRNDPAAAVAAEISALLLRATGDAQDLARGLNAGGLVRTGLAAALETLAGNVGSLHAVTCAFTSDRLLPRLDPMSETHLYRIAQEAVGNAVAHSRGKRIDISLMRDGAYGSLCVRDDGMGIEPSARSGKGIGLQTMGYRAQLIGASLRIVRAAPRGTMVTCVFPSPAAEEERDVEGPA